MADAPKSLYALILVPIIGALLSGMTGFVVGLVVAAVLFFVLQKAGSSDPPKQNPEQPCPFCKKLIPHEIDTCPHCGRALP